MPFYTQNNTQAMLWIPFSCLCDTGYFSSIASCRHGNWLWFPKISSKLALKSQFRADFRLSVASCRHGNWLCFHDPYFTVLFWWLFRISGFFHVRRLTRARRAAEQHLQVVVDSMLFQKLISDGVDGLDDEGLGHRIRRDLLVVNCVHPRAPAYESRCRM